MHLPLRGSVYKETMVLALSTEISQCSWHYISHCKFAFLYKFIPREFDYCVCPSPAPSRRCIPSLSAEYIKLLRWKQSFRPWTLENSSKQMPPCFPDDISDCTACPSFSDIYSYMWLSWIFYSQSFYTQCEVLIEVSWCREYSCPRTVFPSATGSLRLSKLAPSQPWNQIQSFPLAPWSSHL